MAVPCKFGEIAKRWRNERLSERLKDEAADGEAKLPPRRVDGGATGIREDLEELGIFQRLDDGRVNVPDVFRVGYRLGRKGGGEACSVIAFKGRFSSPSAQAESAPESWQSLAEFGQVGRGRAQTPLAKLDRRYGLQPRLPVNAQRTTNGHPKVPC